MLSPRFRSSEKIGSRSCWIGPAPVTYACVDTGRQPDRADDRGGGVLRLGEIELAVEVAVDDLGPAVEAASSVAARHRRGGAVDDALKPAHDTRVVRVRDLEDDRERAFGHFAELLLEERPRALRVGAGHAELVREQRRQPRREQPPDDEDDGPRTEDDAPVPEHESRPALDPRRLDGAWGYAHGHEPPRRREAAGRARAAVRRPVARAALRGARHGFRPERRLLPHRRPARADRRDRATGRRPGERSRRRRRAPAGRRRRAPPAARRPAASTS